MRPLARAMAAVALVVASAVAAQQEAPPLPSPQEIEAAGATIGEIRIVVGDVFDTTDPREDRWLFRAANALHVDTRPGTIERRLLFRPGDRFTVHAIEETERVLRGERFLYDVKIRPVALRDGVVDLEVATRDTWTLYPAISVTRSGGANKSEVSINEANLFGTGSAVTFGYFKDIDRSGTAFDFANENVFGRWTALRFSVADNSDGAKKALSLNRPFYALDTRWSAGIRALDEELIEPVYNAGDLVAEYRHRERQGEVSGGWSRGLVGGWVRRWSLGVSLQDDRFDFEPGRVPPAALPPDEKLAGPFVRFDLIEDRYQKTQNRNQMGRPEFFAVGLNASLQLGRASASFGSTGDAWLYAAAVSRGFETGDEQTLLASAAVRGQLADGRVRRQRSSAGTQFFLPHHGRWLFYASAAGDLLTNPDPSDFLYLGGDTGLRGYPLRYQSGTRRALLTLEERLYTGAFPWRLFRIGAAAFIDVGRAWGGANQNTVNPGWLANAGLGLRFFSVRTAFGNVAHLDVAFPVNRTTDVQGIQVLFRGRTSF